TKMGVFPQYRYPDAVNRYAKVADFLGLSKPGQTKEEKVEALVAGVEDLKEKIGITKTIRDWGIPEKDFLEAVDELSVDAYDDQCTPANPRYPLISELKEIYLKSYYGREEYLKMKNSK
ncbi:iron-containing alcohol dehydrogenase, partial [Streptobacillus moniliformis]|uniref:iron-containing alcohol dehydrogenase n=1 Tax=Streptobacillus moniliformis TaxID=34105 RepID=UPI000A8D7686